MKSKRIAIITVPYITSAMHYRYAMQALNSFKSQKHKIVNIAVINRLDPKYEGKILEKYDHVIRNDKNILARAWNKGVKYALENDFDYFLIPNLDVISTHKTIDQLVNLAEEFPDAVLWCATESKDRGGFRSINNEYQPSLALESHSFSYFMIDKNLFEKVGEFHEGYTPAYFEDWDMRDRIFASGNYAVRGNHIIFFHYENGTRRNDSRAAANVIKMYKVNERHYLSRRKQLLGY